MKKKILKGYTNRNWRMAYMPNAIGQRQIYFPAVTKNKKWAKPVKVEVTIREIS